MKAGLVAMELRKLADALDVQPDEVIIKPWVSFYGDSKNEFLATARLMPRPFKKSVSFDRIMLEHRNDGLEVRVSVPQALGCELVEPAKPAVYRCDPILSELEEA